MTIIQNGQGLEIAVPPGQSIAVASLTGTYSATLLDGAGRGVLASASAGGATYGPYPAGATLRVKAGVDSCVAYDVGASPIASGQYPARFATNAEGDISGLVGPDGNSGSAAKWVTVTPGISSKEVSTANRIALQNALDTRGSVNVWQDGDIFIDTAILIGGQTRLRLGANTTLRLVNGPTNPNTWGTTTLTSTGTAATAVISGSFPASLIGKSVIMGVGGVSNQDGYNGLWQMQIVNGTTATFTLVASVGGVAATGNVRLYGPYMEYGFQDNVIRNKNFFSKKVPLSMPTVDGPVSVGSIALTFTAGAGHGFSIGDWMMVKGDTTRALHGAHRIIAVTSVAVTVEYFSTTVGYPTPAGTLYGMQCDVDFQIEGGTIHGGGGQNADASWLSHGVCLNKTAHAVVQNIRTISVNKYSVTYCNSFAPTFRDIHLETVSDGLHSKGPNWSVVIDGIAGANDDDFIVHTANDPEQAYPFNVFPRNAGATIQTVNGPLTLGHCDQGTIANGGSELIGYHVRNVRPKFKNARILLSGADAAKPFNGMSGVVIENCLPNYDNQATNGSYDIPSICISCEPSTNHTTRISDVTVKNWAVQGNSGKPFINFYDQQVGGPYSGAQLVIDSLTFENIKTGMPIVRKAGVQWEFLDGRVWTSGDRWSIGKLTFRDCRWDVDTGTSGGDCSIVSLNNNNANGEYLKSLVFDNCQLRQVGGNQPLRLLSLTGASGSKLKNLRVFGSHFDTTVASSTLEVISLGNAGATNDLVVTLRDNTFEKVRFALSTNGTLCSLLASGNVLLESVFNCMIYGSGSFATRVYWDKNMLAPGIACFDGGLSGYVIKQGDNTLAVDLSKVSRASAGGVAKASVGAGTIIAGNLAICDATNAAFSWKQLSNTALVY